jgi:hypothetical protein
MQWVKGFLFQYQPSGPQGTEGIAVVPPEADQQWRVHKAK